MLRVRSHMILSVVVTILFFAEAVEDFREYDRDLIGRAGLSGRWSLHNNDTRTPYGSSAYQPHGSADLDRPYPMPKKLK